MPRPITESGVNDVDCLSVRLSVRLYLTHKRKIAESKLWYTDFP